MGKKLYIGNLPFAATEADLREIFGQAGTVESATVVTDRETGRSRGFGFVEMSNDTEAATAISKFNNAEFEGRAITVSEARPPQPRTGGGGGGRFEGRGGPRGGGGGGFRGGRF